MLPTGLTERPLPLTPPIPNPSTSLNRDRARKISDSNNVVAQWVTSVFEHTHLGSGNVAPPPQQNGFVYPIPNPLWGPSQAGCSITAANNPQALTASGPPCHLNSVATPQSAEPCTSLAGERGSYPDNVQKDRPPPQPRETTSTQATEACGQEHAKFGGLNANVAQESITWQLGRPMTPPSGARFPDLSVYGRSPPANRVPSISRRSFGRTNSLPTHRTQPPKRTAQPRVMLKDQKAQGALARQGSTSSQAPNSGGETVGTALLQSIFAPPAGVKIPASQERATPKTDAKGRGKKRVREAPQDSEELPKRVTVRRKTSSKPKPKPRVVMIQDSKGRSRGQELHILNLGLEGKEKESG